MSNRWRTEGRLRRGRLFVLVLVLSLLWPAPSFGRVLYRCIETGEFLRACCRELPEDEKPVCCEDEQGGCDESLVVRVSESESECDCCDLVYEFEEQTSGAKDRLSSASSIPLLPQSGAGLSAAPASRPESRRGLVAWAPRAPPARALFQVFETYLI